MVLRKSLLVFALAFLVQSISSAADWPMWRHDSSRLSVTSEQLDDSNLELHWKRQYSEPRPAWHNQQEVYCYGGPGYEIIQKLSFDIAYQPVVMGDTMYVGSMNSDWVAAIDLNTGVEKWKYFTNGPVRFAPVAIGGKIYVGSDDGFMYCLDTNGNLVWKVQGGPTNRKILGNDRMISIWPVRGGAIVPTEIDKYPTDEYMNWLAERIPASKDTFSILDGNDDVEEEISDGGIDISSSDLELNREHTDEDDYQVIGLRFQNKFYGLEKGAVVNSASIQFTVDETKGGTDAVTLRIYGEYSANSAAFSGVDYEVSSRTKTSAYVDWAVPQWDEKYASGPDQQTPDISSIINEMVQHADWTKDSPITIIVEPLSGTGIRCAESLNGDGVGPVLKLDSADTVEKDAAIPTALVDELPNPAYAAWYKLANDPEAKYFGIAKSLDDTEEKSSGSLYTDSSDLEICHDGGEQVIGMRFTNSNFKIAKGAAVQNAFIQFTVDETKGGTNPLKVKITGHKSGTSGDFSGSYGISGRTRTTAEVIWDIPATWTSKGASGADQRTPDISSIVNEIIASDDWNDNSAITLIIEYIEGDGIRCAESKDGNGVGPVLILDENVTDTVLVGTFGDAPAEYISYSIGNNDSLIFAAGSYPFEGTFTYSVDKETGEIKWCNDKDYMYFTENPHGGSEGYNGNGPQGYLAAGMDNKILVPNGRNRPACFDSSTGELLFHMIPRSNGVSKGDGGYFCSTLSGSFYTNSRYGCKSYSLLDGRGTGGVTNYLMDEDHLVIVAGGQYFEAGCIFGYIDHLHPGYDDSVFKVSGGDFYYELDARPAGLLAANGHLVVTTTDGWIYCFGEGQPQNGPVEYDYTPAGPGQHYDPQAGADLIASAGYTDGQRGNCVVIGLEDGNLVEGIVRQSDMTVVAFETDTNKVDSLREYFEDRGLYGTRVHIIPEEFETADVPSYCAHVIASEKAISDMSQSVLSEVFRVLRPYGGTAVINYIGQDPAFAATPVNADMVLSSNTMKLTKVGKLPGSADWTHQHGNVQQTTLSQDELVKLPMGILWFGGSMDNTNDKILPRHGHGPSPQVIGGRYYIEGLDVLRCVDIYTGRVLWEKQISNLGQFSNYTDHQAGQLAVGDNYVCTEDKIYVLGEHADNDWPVECLVLDPATGAELNSIALPENAGWGMIAVYEDYLIACGYPMNQDTYGFDSNGDLFPAGSGWVYSDSDPKVGVGGMGTYNGSTSEKLFVLDRHDGSVQWQTDASFGFFHNSIVAGNDKLFVMDRVNWDQDRPLEDRDHNWGNGSAPDAAEDYSYKPAILSAFNIADGSVAWQVDQSDPNVNKGLFGSWLTYSLKYDILLECQRASRDYWENHKSSTKMTAWQGAGDGTGNAKQIWSELDRFYWGGPVMLNDDMIITQSGNDMGAVNLLTGEPYMVASGVTGKLNDFAGFKRYGCGTALACKNMILFRSGNCGYYDLNTFSGTGNWGGFKTGCTINLMPANGLIVAPEYTRTCGCSYQFQTSCAMIHREDVEQWSCNKNLGSQYKAQGGRMKKVGLNFGAIGDRVEEEVLWMEYPFGEPAAGYNYQIPVNVNVDNGSYFRHHMLTVDGDLCWVGASGVCGATCITADMYDPAKTCFKDTIPQDYNICLYFAEPDKETIAGEREFSVNVNGHDVGTVDVVSETGSARKVLVKKLQGVRIADKLDVTLTPITGEPVLSGVSMEMIETQMAEGDLDNDGEVNHEDLKIMMNYRRGSADSEDDPRDLDGDGQISVRDARKLVILMRNYKKNK